MRIAIAFVTVIIIWSTTPLAIKWSSDGASFIFAVMSRMLLGAAMCVAILMIKRRRLPMNRHAIITYVAAAAGIYGAMLSVYWGAQYISSGLIAVIFGLTPIVTAVMAHHWLGENSLTPGKIFAVLLGLSGVSVIYMSNLALGPQAYYGIVAMLSAVLIHSGSGVWVKRVGVKLGALELTSGSLLFVTPAYLITWLIMDGQLPMAISGKALAAIFYLGIVGSVVGFSLYFYILKNMAANKVALTTLVTPVLALLIGHYLNAEYIPVQVWFGTGCIITALIFHQWGDRVLAQVYMRKAKQ